MPLFQLKNQTAKKLKSYTANKERDIQRLIETNLFPIFEMWMIKSEYTITAARRIDTLAVDSNGSPVIIEYKKRSDENVINQSISYLKWLKEQKPEFFEKMVENHVKDFPKDIKLNWEQPRVICVAESFNKYDLDTVEMIKGIKIELYRYRYYDENIFQLEQYNVEEKPDAVLEKKGAAPIENTGVDRLLEKCSDEVKANFAELRARIFQLDTNIEERTTPAYVAYRLSKHFVEFHFNKNDIKLYLRPADYKDDRNMIEKIPDSFNWSMNRRVYLRSAADIDYVMELVKQSYNDVL